MSIDPREIDCFEYVNSIKDIEEFSGMGLYNLDVQRTKLHEKLCESFKLSVEETKSITDNLDLSDSRTPENLYLALLELSQNKGK